MATLSLKISLEEGKVIKTMQFDPSTSVFDACKVIRDKILEANLGEPKDYGIFLSSDEDNKKGVWLEPGRSLEYYMLRNGDMVEYKKKMRTLRVRMLDGTLKTMMVDDSQNVANLMVVICTKIGITNYDEYSLVRDDIKDELDNIDLKSNYGTLTLKRKHAEKERDAKMDQLRKKLRTDDEVNWIDPSKTLREQGVDESETVLLRRKFFYSDQNIDSRDPVQLNLLYVQARDAILDGTHPVTLDKACEFAGIQCQIQFGDHKEDKHTPGFLDLKEFLPQSYMKMKGVEKKVFKEHKSHLGLSELDSKVVYTKTARALRTYGVAFFLVKEKMKGKNKLVPRLLGVTKESVLRLDERTKEIMQTWPLTTVRRWCASPNTFTLDFGDYSDQYYSVQTTEAEQILQVIAGYIDIILKKQKAKDHFGIEGDEGSTMVEDSVSPHRATILQHETSKVGKQVNTESVAKPAVMRLAEGVKPYSQGHMGGAQFTTVSGQVNVGHTIPAVQQTKVTSVMSEPQRALLSTISSGQEVIRITERELIRAPLPELGSDPASIKWKEVTLDTNKQNVSSQIAAMNAATAQVVTLTSGPTDEVDHTAVGAAITTIASNLPQVTKGVQMIAALMDDNDNGDRLLDATRRLCNAFSDLLKAAEPETKEPRQNLLNAASRVGEASTQVLHTIGENNEESREIQDMLLALAKAVANTTAALVLKAKNIAATCKDDQQAQNRVIGAATQCALATSQLVACAKVVAGTLHNPACREQLAGAARQVGAAVRRLVAECEKAAPDAAGLPDLTQAAADVARALDDLLNHVNTDRRHARETVHETSVESIMTAADRLVSSSGEPGEMVRQARLLGQATAQLIQNIKMEADKQPDSETQRRLLAAAKLLADATAKMVEAARQCASSPHDRSKQEALCRAAEELRYVTTDYAASTPEVRRQLFNRLGAAAKQAASAGTQFIASAQNAGAHNTNRHSQDALVQECRSMAEHIPRLIEGVKGTINDPDDSNTQLDLITASEAFLQPGAHAVQAARAVLPTVQDQSTALQLNNTTQQLATSCSELRSVVSRARSSCTGLELDAAAQIIRSLQRELEEVDQAAREMRLRPLPGETAELASRDLGAYGREVGFASARLVSAARQGSTEYAGRAAGEAAQALRGLAGATRALAATTDKPSRVIDSTQDVMAQSLSLVEEAKRCLSSPDSSDSSRLNSIAKNVTIALDNSVNSLPGHQDVDMTIDTINETLQILSSGEFPTSDKTYGQLQEELHEAAEGLSGAAADTVQAAESPAQLGETSKQFGSAYNQLLGVGMEMAAHTTDYEVQSQMVVSMKNVSVVSSKLLTTAKWVSNDPSQPNARNQLSAAARAVTESINSLVDVCTSGAPGSKECDSAMRNIQSARILLQNPSQPVNELGYYQCVDTIVEHSKTINDGIANIANHAKKSEHELLGRDVTTVSESIYGLIECTAQASYLVAASDPSSVAGRPGLVDQAQFARASQVIQQACSILTNPASNQQQILTAATMIAKHTSALCNACRVASSKTTNPVAKRHFVQSAKDVANSTAQLVKEIKALDNDYSEANRVRCADATVPLLEAVDSLCQFAGSPEFVSIPAKISPQARRAQEPIMEGGRKIIQGSYSMIESAKELAVRPNDQPMWHSMATHSRTVYDNIKHLVSNIRDKAPGQSECLAALETLNSQIREVDSASLQAVSQTLPAKKGNSLQGYTEQMESSVTEMLDKLEPLRSAAKFEAENLGHCVNQMMSYTEPLVTAAIGVASNMVDTQQQQAVLDQTKTVLEGTTQLILAAKEAGGNPRATSVHPDVDEHSQGVRDAAGELLSSAEALSAQQGVVSGLLDSLTRSMTRITDHRMSLIGSFNEADSFVDYQTRMVGAAKEIARLATDMTAKSGTDVSKLATLAGDLTHRYNQLAQDSVGAAAATTNSEVAGRLRGAVLELGGASGGLVKAAGVCQVSRDPAAQRQVTDNARVVKEKVGAVLSALQAGSRGTQACIDAAATVAAIIGDLDTTILFASAGTLHADNENDSFADHRESILKTAKVLVEDTKTLVGGAASSQEQLASAAQNAVTTIVQLSEVVKLGAMSLGSGNPDSQVMLIHAVRDVAAALKDLIQATKDASGKHIGDPAMTRLKDSAKVMVTNVTSLLKTVKAVEDEHTRGTRALEATIEAIAQEIRLLMSGGAPKLTATPEELVRCTKAITVATAKAVAAGNSAKQDDIIAAANIGRRAIGDMLAICKGAAYKCCDSEELRVGTLRAGQATATAYRQLLQAVLRAVQGQHTARQEFPELSRAVAQAAADIVAQAEALKGSDWVDPNDPTVIAENELLGAAASIDAAANKLAALRPRKSVKEADETLNFDEMILEAAKSIIAATSALVRAASAAQRELIDQGKVARRPLHSSDDGQWSEGLVSAARLTAAAAHSLAEAANALVQGLGSEERLVSSAKQVAGSTAQLLVACKVKADPNSESTRRLQAAGNAVIKSTDNLVRAAQRAISHEEERVLVLNRKMVGGMKQEIDARSDVLRKERELEEARGRLTAIRIAKNRFKGGDTSGDETDNEIRLHSDSYGSRGPYEQGYGSDSPTQRNYTNNTSYQSNSTYGQNNSTFGQNNTSFGQNNTSFGQNQNNTSFGQNNTSFGQNQNNTSFGQNNSSFGQNGSINKSSYSTSSMERQQNVKYPSPPPPNPPPPMTTNLSTFSRTSSSSLAHEDSATNNKTPQNYEGFTTRSANNNTNYETRRYDVPRPLELNNQFTSSDTQQQQRTYNQSNSAFSTYSSMKQEQSPGPRVTQALEKPKPPPASPLSPKFNAKFDLKREFESSDLSRNNYSQNLSSVHDVKTEQNYTFKSNVAPTPPPVPSFLYGTTKSPTPPKPFSTETMRMETFSQQKTGNVEQSPFSTLESNSSFQPRYTVKSPKSPLPKSPQPNTGYSETNQTYSFKTETSSKPQVNTPSHDLSRVVSVQSPKQENIHLFGKEVYNYGGPNYSQETMTEVKEIPNGTQKVTTTKIYSSTPMKITSTNMKYESNNVGGANNVPSLGQYDSMHEFNKQFGNESKFNTINSSYSSAPTDTMRSNISNAYNEGPSFLKPSDYKQTSDYQSEMTVSKSVKSPADLTRELDSMEKRLMKQTISSEVIEKKTVMTSSSKSETSSTTTKKFGNF